MSDQEALSVIKKDIADHFVFLYMKGTPDIPQCGFSAFVVGVLRQIDVAFGFRNVLEDSSIRAGIKIFSSWPTIPQLYVNQEFIGGADIVKEKHASGALKKLTLSST